MIRWLRETGHKASHERDVANLRWLDPYLGHLTISQINRDLVERIGEAKRAATSNATANRVLALLRAILRRARDDWEWVDTVPKVRLFPERRRRVRWITREQAARLLAELPPHLRDLAAFTLATGLRQRNASFLRWDQLDMARQVAWVHHDETKARRAIAVPLNADAVKVLRRRMGRDSGYVFTYKGRPVERCSTRAWTKALDRAGIEDFRWHDLRHTWASWHVQSGTSLQELMELGSWSSYEMVLRYAHLAADHLRDAACRIEATNSAQSRDGGSRPKIVSL